MKLNWTLKLLAACALFTVMAISCKKEDAVVTAPEVAHFTNQEGGSYSITAPGVTFKVPVGFTTVSDKDRTVTVSVTSPTGAVQGTHYTLGSTTVTIPAGKAVDSLTVTGNYSQYIGGRKDTLVFTIVDAKGAATNEYNSVYKLFMRGPCFEGDVNLNDLLGTYKNTNETFGNSPYGPYTTTISAVNQLTPTTGTITVTNIWDYGWKPIVFKLDWTDPNNRIVTLDPQSGIADGGTVNSAYTGQDVSVRAFAGQNGTFSVCKQTVTLKLQVGITGLGWFGSLYTVNMAR